MVEFWTSLESRHAIPAVLAAASVVLLSVLVGCATPPSVDVASRPAAPFGANAPILGPGAVFGSVDEAAIDALAWCYLQARRDGRTRRVRGGSIRPVVGGGFTYDAVAKAPRFEASLVRFALHSGDVAHFRHYPEAGAEGNESHSRSDRRNVDRADPLHRPSYLLTPRLVVRIYRGRGSEALLAKLDRTEIEHLRDRARGR